ncbi:MAG: acyl carrier protein [Candidatus Thiodiazotropha sp. (ex Lucinoma kastoroae)]|nr:acyl carrier protein [Candidatus Thiodiazotropha sp. (ex Rostrolucina anterorostrata)]MCU7849884.1 acyl carrier protein [Candidatus Thiodiazotropha sp. (ex Lucinoma kastoroae)]MCU7858298.1 acyl carrier protein [Candidatus Thiodiazotropha sp. (ex Lucinoma kastoroae)]
MQEQLKSFIFSELVFADDPDSFTEDDDLLDAGLDSMGIMRLVIFVEEELGVILPDDELEPENLRNLSRLESWIKSHQ